MHKREMLKLYKFTIKIREYEENVKLQKENSYNLHNKRRFFYGTICIDSLCGQACVQDFFGDADERDDHGSQLKKYFEEMLECRLESIRLD